MGGVRAALLSIGVLAATIGGAPSAAGGVNPNYPFITDAHASAGAGAGDGEAAGGPDHGFAEVRYYANTALSPPGRGMGRGGRPALTASVGFGSLAEVPAESRAAGGEFSAVWCGELTLPNATTRFGVVAVGDEPGGGGRGRGTDGGKGSANEDGVAAAYGYARLWVDDHILVDGRQASARAPSRLRDAPSPILPLFHFSTDDPDQVR